MIVEQQDRWLVLIEQEAHARLTGELAAHLPFRLEHHAAFVAAARVHDNGWREADRAPTVDGDGSPHTFNNVPDATYEDLWRRGITRAAGVDELVGLLVGLHGARFFESRDSPGMQALLEDERRRQDEVLHALGLGGSWQQLPEEVARSSAWIAALDALSLLLCGAGLPDQISPRVDGQAYTLTRTGRAAVTMAPWPYDEPAVRTTVSTRRIAAGSYPHDQALRTALASASWERRQVTLTPG